MTPALRSALLKLAADMLHGEGLPSDCEDDYTRISRTTALAGFAQSREQARRWALTVRRIVEMDVKEQP